jgi:FkbM family methyltransferase
MIGLKKYLYMICVFATCFAYADESDIAKAVDRANSAFAHAGGGPERHRALITAYWVNEGDTVLDLGAHVGTFSLFYSQLVGATGTVVAYEASPPIYDYMIARFGSVWPNIIPRNRAVSDTTNQTILMKIYPNDIGPQSSTVEQQHWNEGRMPGNTAIVEVLTEKVDDFIKNHNTFSSVRFIKIDTEGHEHAVIRGAMEVLLEHRPLVIFEYGYQKAVWEPDTVRQMEELGYVCYDCNTDQLVRPGYGDNAVPYLLTDLLAIPVEFEEEIKSVLPYLH